MKRKHLLSMIFTILIIVQIMGISAYAFPGNYFWFPRPMHVRIYHPSTDMVLGIDRNGNETIGARLQLQRYEEGNQNQIFFLKPIARDSDGRIQYQIRVHGENDMIIEVANGSHEDLAPVQQCKGHTEARARWYFYTETNKNGSDKATCCIRNVESGKMLNVCGNEARDGNGMIQYHEDGTWAEVFWVFSVEDDIIGAMWSRDWSFYDDEDEVLYATIERDTPENRRKYNTPINEYANGLMKAPVTYTKNKGYLATVIWADGNLQKKLLQLHNPPKNGWELIGEAIGGAGEEYIIDKVFENTPLGAIPTGDVKSIIATIMAAQSEQQWYRIEKAFEEHSKVRIEIYYVFNSGMWGTSCQAIVNDETDTYWDGKKASIETTIYDFKGRESRGSVEYFYK